ncbi:hypothetical protein DL98DRAFT_653303 [Cadophora sp. DSE1049]|nr:hypothetical protein DL98DRAFT_653303 [Cadophora sp. DSE1049]
MGSSVIDPESRPQLPKPSIRSTNGCWTCRLRKKKCDETPSACLRCEAASLECRYGAKPCWIESPELGKRELERIKGLVAVTASRKRAEHRARVRSKTKSAPLAVKSPSLLQEFGSEYESHLQAAVNKEHRTVWEYQAPNASQPDGSGLQDNADSPPRLELSSWIKDHEANLIMHYLDHVFYIQFRFYVPSVAAGGRGWVLSLITKTKPLYHAALSLAAFHQQSLMLQENGEWDESWDDDRLGLGELEKQHNLTLQEMQRFIQAHSVRSDRMAVLDHNVQILACVVQLISFELFKGGASNWSVHLKAGCDLVLMIHEQILKHDCGPLHHQQPTQGAQTSSPESNALRFFTGCIIWFDILSCVSTNTLPNLAAYHRRLLLGQTPETGRSIELHAVCGAQNWVMILIGEISALAHQNQKMSWRRVVDSDYNAQGFEAAARDIETRLRSQYRRLHEELATLRRRHDGPPSHSLPEIYAHHTVLVVTSIFVSAAAIYLQTATIRSSDLTPSYVKSVLQDTINSMEMIPDHRIFRGLVWPLCVAGCMASAPEDQEFFLAKAKGAVSDSRSFGNSGKALEVLERSWELQKQMGILVDCSVVLKDLGTSVLLV